MNDHRTFGDYLTPIAGYRTLHLLDQRGCGGSGDVSPTGYTIARLVEDIEETRAAFDHDTIDLIGHSYGGLIALQYALRWPERIRTLIIVGCPARGWKGVIRSPSAWPIWSRQMLLNLKKEVNWTEFALKYDVGNRERLEAVRTIISVPKRFDPMRAKPLMGAAFEPIDVRTLPGRVRAAAIFGKQDRRFVWDAPYLRSKGFDVHIIDNCGHFPYIEQPKEFHLIIRRLLMG